MSRWLKAMIPILCVLAGAVLVAGPSPQVSSPELPMDGKNAIDAAKSCPVAAIFIKDETGKQLFPA